MITMIVDDPMSEDDVGCLGVETARKVFIMEVVYYGRSICLPRANGTRSSSSCPLRFRQSCCRRRRWPPAIVEIQQDDLMALLH